MKPLSSSAAGPAASAAALEQPVPKKKFLDECRDEARFRQLSYRTEQSYVRWIRQFILHRQKRHPRDMGAVRSPLDLVGVAARSAPACAGGLPEWRFDVGAATGRGGRGRISSGSSRR
jgi:hypothetical protein